MRVRFLAAVVAAALGLAGAAQSAGTARADLPYVTVIGDSVLTAVYWNAKPLSILGQGLNLQMEIGVCRRLTGVSCPYEGGEVPTLVDLVPILGSSIAKTVVVEVGYDDPADTFAASVEQALQALFQAGVTRILWVNLHEAQGQYQAMNGILDDAAVRHPQLTIVDWSGYSAGHWGSVQDPANWFQNDGIHLVYNGAVAMATLLHQAILQSFAPPAATPPPPQTPPVSIKSTSLPVARVGYRYSVRLGASGGTPPYRWRVISGPLPAGLRLLADGTLTGTPRHARVANLVFQADDANGATASRGVTLVILGKRLIG